MTNDPVPQVDESISPLPAKYSRTVAFAALFVVVAVGAFAGGAVSQSVASASGSTSLFAAAAAAITGTAATPAVLASGIDNPAAGSVQVNASSTTGNITLNTFTVTAKASDETLRSVSMIVDVSPTSVPVGSVVQNFKLYQGTTLIGTVSGTVTGTTTLAFTNIGNVQVPANSTIGFRIAADANPISSSFPEGTKLRVNVQNTGITLEKTTASGSKAVKVTGSSLGNYQTFHLLGLSADATPAVNKSSTSSFLTYTFTFNVSAFGQDVFLPSVASRVFLGGFKDAAGKLVAASAVSFSSTADRTPLGNYVIHNGQTKSVTLTLTHVGSTTLSAYISSINYGVTDLNPLGRILTLPKTYTSN